MSKLKAILIITLLILPMGFIDKPNNYKISSDKENFESSSARESIRLIKPSLEVKKLEDRIFSLKIPVDLRGYKIFTDNGRIIPFYEGGELEVAPGRPIIPTFVFVRRIPIDAKIINVKLDNFSYISERIDKEFVISPNPLAIGYNVSYSTSISISNYPSKWIEYEIKYGLDPESLERVKFLIIRFYPVRIIDRSTLLRATNAIISISFARSNLSLRASQTESSAELLIITNRTLYPYALELAKMKNESGIPTIVRLVEDIYAKYSGRDNAEKIRFAINDTVNSYGIKYLLIFGDSDVVPVRYVYVPDGAFDDQPEIDGKFVETDLYYADLQYTWDDNNDGLWGDLKHDRVDGIPDIFIGRIPASTPEEAEAYLKKLKEYKPVEGWWNRALLIGTDTFMRFTPEGEYLSENISKYIFSNFTTVKLYETGENISLLSLLHHFSLGYGFINYAGHGDNHLLYITLSQSFTSVHAESLNNAPRFPVVFTMACSSGRFGDIDGFGERLVLNPNGGAIAYVGSSRIAWGYISKYVTIGLAGGMNVLFVKSLFSPLRDRLGRVWGNMITQYVLKHDFRREELGYGYIEWKTIVEYNLLGDPTLSFKAKVYENETTISGNFDNLVIENAYSKLSGDVSASNITIVNSTIDLSGFNITAFANISIINSTIIGEGYIILSNNANASLTSSDLSSPIKMSENSNVTARNSAFSIISSSSNIHLKLINSSVKVDYELSSGSYVLDAEDGFFDSKTFSLVDAALDDSFISWRISAINANVNLSNSITELTLFNSTANIDRLNIAIVRILNGSKLTAENSRIGVLFIELQNYNNITINPGNITCSFPGADLSNVTVEFVSIRAIAGVDISSSKILNLIVDGKTHIRNSNIARIIANNDVDIVDSEAFFIGIHNGKANLISVNVTHVLAENSHVTFNRSDIYTAYFLTKSNVIIYNSTMFHADFRFDSYVEIQYSDIYEIVTFENSRTLLKNSSVLMLTMYNSSQAELIGSSISYLLRQYDETYVTLKENSTATPQLTFKNVNVTIRDLPVGFISSQTFKFESFNWALKVENSVIEFWDINAYGASLTIENAYIYWILAYYNSIINIKSSVVYVIKATHDSKIYAENILNLVTFASSNACVEIKDSMIVLQLAFLESSEGFLSNIVFGEILAMGNAKVKVSKSIGNDIAVLENSEVTVDDTKSQLWIYVEDTDLSDITISLRNGFINSWSLSDLSQKFPMKISVKNSLISWLLLFWNSSTRVSNSEVNLLAFLQCDKPIIVTDTVVADLAYFYDVNASVENVTFSNITTVINTTFLGEKSKFFVFFMWNSSIRIKSSFLAPGIVLEDSNGVLKNFRPYRGDFKIGDYFSIDTRELDFEILNSSIIGLIFNLFGRANLTVENSAFDGIVLFENSSTTVKDSVLGAIYSFNYSRTIVKNSSIDEIWFYIKRYHGSLTKFAKDISYLHLNYGSSEIELINSNVSKWSVTAFSSTLRISNSLNSLEIISSNVILENSSISKLSVTESQIEILKSKVSSLTLSYYSKATITNSSISFLRYDSSIKAEIEQSNIGLYLRLLNVHGKIVLGPVNRFNGSMKIIPADITFKEVNITNFFLYVGGFSYLSIEYSKIHIVSISGKSTVMISSSTIDSLTINDQSIVSIMDSEIGLELLFRDVYSSDEIKVPSGDIFSEYQISIPFQWSIKFSSSTVDWINITILGSNKFALSSKILYLIVFGGDVKLEDSRVGLASFYFSKLTIKDCGIGYALFEGASVEISSTNLGIVKMVLGSFVYSEEKMRKVTFDEILDLENGNTLILLDSLITDYSYVLLFNSTLIANNSRLGILEARDSSYALLINSTLEMVPYVEAFAVIEIYWYLTIKVTKDFMPANSANVTIYRNSTAVAKGFTNKDGKISFLLPQAKITADKRLDLGKYKVIAEANGLKGEKEVYLYNTLTVEIFLISPWLLILIVLTIAAIIIFVFQEIQKRKSRRKAEYEYQSANF